MTEKNNDTRRKLIDEGLKAMIVTGYDGIGLNAILDSAGVPKGSFYYFFKSKEDFVVAVLDDYERYYTEMRNRHLGDVAHTPLQRLRNYFDEVERIHLAEAPLGGCLYGVLGQTAAVRSPEFRERLARVFSTWEDQLADLLRQAQDLGEIDARLDANEAAAFLIDAYEGMLIRMKADGNAKAFERFKRLALGALMRAAA